jgi:hypothetical protein
MTDVRLRIRAARGDEVAIPFLDLVHERVGARRGQRVIAFVLGWGVAAEHLERVPSLEEYAARFQIPIATAYREQALFREAFWGEDTPDRILGVLWDQLGRKPERLRSMSVCIDLDGPPEASVVLAWFVATLLDRLPAGAANAVDRALPPLASSARARREEVERAYRLADRAIFSWAAAMLRREDPALAQGLSSLERLRPFETSGARYAAAILGEYAVGAPKVGPVCEAAARAAEAAAALGVRARPSNAASFARVGGAAADTLRLAFSDAAITDVVTPAREIVDALLPAAGRDVVSAPVS